MEVFLKAAIPASIFLMTIAIGIDLRVDDFKRLLVEPKAILAGVLGQLFFLPSLSFALAYGLPMSTELTVGMMILSACPGGAMSNFLTYMAQGDTALSVSMTAISNLLNILTLPIIVNLALYQFVGTGDEVSLPVGQTIAQLAGLTLVPVSLGMFVRARQPAWTDRYKPTIQRGALLILAIVITATFAAQGNLLVKYVNRGALQACLIAAIAIAIGHSLAYFLGLPKRQSITIAIEFCIQNVATAVLVAATLLGKTEYALFSGIYLIASLLVLSFYIFWQLRFSSPKN